MSETIAGLPPKRSGMRAGAEPSTALPLMPEWYLVIAALALLALLGISWPPLVWAAPLLLVAVALPLVQAALAATRAQFPVPPESAGERIRRWTLTFTLHLLQPLARLIGRLTHGLTPWRLRFAPALATRPDDADGAPASIGAGTAASPRAGDDARARRLETMSVRLIPVSPGGGDLPAG